MRSRVLSLSCCFLVGSPLFGWWETGHRAVARLAASQLTPAARVRIARILAVAESPEAVAEALAQASTWADETKAETRTGSWHFIDLTLQDSRADIPKRCEHDDCVTARIRLFAAQLTAQKQEGHWSEVDALRYVVHFVGDIHQPLHAASDADLGGNCELLDPPIGEAKNVHALWDGEIVNALDQSDKTLAANLESYAGKLDGERRSSWSTGNAEDWAWESHLLARDLVYSKLHIPTQPVVFPHGCANAPAEIRNFKPQVDNLYIDNMKPVVRDQLTKAGLRLARVLNESL